MNCQLNILVAEDENIIADSYKLFLESRKHKVIVCSDGEQCLRTFNEYINKLESSSNQLGIKREPLSNTPGSAFDLIILDYRMPKKNGIEVAEEILSKVPNQRILLASAYSHELTGSEVIPKLEVLHKPFEFDVFAGIVEQGSANIGTSKSLKQSATSSPIATNPPGTNFHDNEFMHTGDISHIFGF